MVKNIGIILAGGQGARTSFDVPKQLVKVAGLPLVEHVIRTFQFESMIDEICIVTSTQSRDAIQHIVGNKNYNKVKKILLGGKERYHSSMAAIDAYKEEAVTSEIRFIFHDAVRPLLTPNLLKKVVLELKKSGAVDVVVPVADTVIQSDPEGLFIRAIPPRPMLRLGQTPQGFHFRIIEQAYRHALMDPNFTTTDDCGVVLKYLPEVQVKLVEGERSNIKLTYDEDLHIIDRLFQLRSVFGLPGGQPSESLSGKVIVVIGASSGIGWEIMKKAEFSHAHVYGCSRASGVDVTKAGSVKNYLEKVCQKEGHIDSVINTAGLLMKQPLVDMSEEDVTQMLSVNLGGSVNVAREAYSFLSKTQGHLVFFASSSYTYGREFYSLYSASKAAIVNLCQALANEWYDSGIKVNCISPERTRTPMRVKNFGIEPVENLLDPQDVASVTLRQLTTSISGAVIDVSLPK